MTTHATKSKKKYVKLAPTTFFRVPECYGTKEPDVTSEKCWLCPVRRQCDKKQETVMR